MTASWVKDQIAAKYGAAEAKKYDPRRNAMTFAQWVKNGYAPKKGEHGFRSIVILEKKDTKGNVIRRFPKNIVLFYRLQVSPITAK